MQDKQAKLALLGLIFLSLAVAGLLFLIQMSCAASETDILDPEEIEWLADGGALFKETPYVPSFSPRVTLSDWK